MRAPQPRCEVCCGEASKYRCPKCMRRYCSLPCYRSHKGNCVAVSIEKSRNENMAEIFNSQEKEDGEVSNSDSEDTEDKVPEESLKKLNDSDELKLLLANPHLRDMLVALNTSQKPEHDIEMAMREPIFVEFADQCLEIVRDKATETYFTR